MISPGLLRINMENTQKKIPLRYRWSHHLWIHRILVRFYNAVVAFVPFGIKYGIGKSLRRNKFPYCLIDQGKVKTTVQIGAPRDTLRAGRSRAAYFSLFNKGGGTIVIEPDPASKLAFEGLTQKGKLRDLRFYESGAWSEKKDVKLYVNPSHPATNFTEGTVDYGDRNLDEYEVVHVPCDTVDNILTNLDVDKVDLISMTTNGAEVEILQGMRDTLAKGVTYICVAKHDHLKGYTDFLESLDYRLLSYDDRGFTYIKNDDSARS